MKAAIQGVYGTWDERQDRILSKNPTDLFEKDRSAVSGHGRKTIGPRPRPARFVSAVVFGVIV